MFIGFNPGETSTQEAISGDSTHHITDREVYFLYIMGDKKYINNFILHNYQVIVL